MPPCESAVGGGACAGIGAGGGCADCCESLGAGAVPPSRRSEDVSSPSSCSIADCTASLPAISRRRRWTCGSGSSGGGAYDGRGGCAMVEICGSRVCGEGRVGGGARALGRAEKGVFVAAWMAALAATVRDRTLAVTNMWVDRRAVVGARMQPTTNQGLHTSTPPGRSRRHRSCCSTMGGAPPRGQVQWSETRRSGQIAVRTGPMRAECVQVRGSAYHVAIGGARHGKDTILQSL